MMTQVGEQRIASYETVSGKTKRRGVPLIWNIEESCYLANSKLLKKNERGLKSFIPP